MGKKKILVVDDAEDALMIMEHILQLEDYAVVKARTGEEAIELSRKELPNLILLDIKLPGMDGPAVAEVIKATAETKDIPIIFLTGLLSKREEKELGHTIAGNFFLAKPCDREELLAEIAKRI